jgi:hypothetical protein
VFCLRGGVNWCITPYFKNVFMNKKKSEHKRIYGKGLMTGDERSLYNKEKEQERFEKKKLSNKKLTQRFTDSVFPGNDYGRKHKKR